MKKSNYNFVLEYKNDSYLLYNSLTGALAILSKEEYELFENSNIDQDNHLKDDLKNGGFIIEDGLDELSLMRYLSNVDKYSNKYVSYTIAVTNDCNFRCIYCYEKNNIKPEYLNIETALDVISFIKENAKNSSGVSICWYGGEPLLNMEAISTISNELIPFFNEKNISYDASIITNGYCLTKSILRQLKEYKVSSMQITIDGNKDIHDSRRILSNGLGTFDKIISNLKTCKDELMRTSIRINVDKTNLELAKDTVEMIKNLNLGEMVSTYYGLVQSIDGCYNENECLNTETFGKEVFERFYKGDNVNLKGFYPYLKRSYCQANSNYSFVINPDGTLCKCWDHVGDKNLVIGDVKKGLKYTPALVNVMTNDPTLHEVCSKCKYIPICMGTCPTKDLNKNYCSTYKYNLEAFLLMLAEQLENE